MDAPLEARARSGWRLRLAADVGRIMSTEPSIPALDDRHPPVMDARTLVDYAASLDCIHCGLCLNSCPTYRLTGVETSSPRGRIHLMRSLAEGHIEADAEFADEMEFCLLCRNCESVCPSGVKFGAMMEHTRAGLEHTVKRSLPARFARWFGFRVLLPHRGALRAFTSVARLVQRSGLLRAIAPLLGRRGSLLLSAPSVPASSERIRLPELTPARGEPRGSVAVLEGCVMPELYGRVNRATVSVLAARGFEVRCPRKHACCGSLHAHNGVHDEALRLARATIRAFDEQGDTLPIVVNSAGCSAHMKDYGRLLHDEPEWSKRAARFSARVVDFTEFLAKEIAARSSTSPLPQTSKPDDPLRDLYPITYDDPCHLCHAQGIRKPPRALLDAIPGMRRVELQDSELCCGSAGIYSLLRPEDSAAVFAPKLEALRKSGARTLVTANPGCQLQWETGLARAGVDVRVMHIAEVLGLADPR
jgi:glycolate oxidase iron-sulfur subunit